MKTFFAIIIVIGLTAFIGMQTYSAIKEIRAKRKRKGGKDADTDGNN